MRISKPEVPNTIVPYFFIRVIWGYLPFVNSLLTILCNLAFKKQDAVPGYNLTFTFSYGEKYFGCKNLLFGLS